MTVDVEPLELSFQRPFTVEVSRTLTIRNTSSTPLAFKVKTTAPKQYCVRPNAGRIEPGNAFDVTVLLQAMKQDPPLDAKCRDKFLVQAAPITSDKDFASIATVLESADKSQLTERKVRVNWLASGQNVADIPAVSTPSKPSAVNGVRNPSREQSVGEANNSQAVDTPDAQRTFSSPAVERSTPGSAPPPYTNDGDAAADDKPKSVVAQAAASASSAAQVTYEELKNKLAKAEAQLASLKDGGLRQRNVKAAVGDEKSPAGNDVAQPAKQPDGVPVQIVAILCLLSFLLAYLFF